MTEHRGDDATPASVVERLRESERRYRELLDAAAVESEVGMGSRFDVYLPAAADSSKASASVEGAR
ncbi:MAG TPA: hypothetical protein VGP50_12500 [Stellaceae bacterium]|nr:hypothetical protein [Stellaceae bacterium]